MSRKGFLRFRPLADKEEDFNGYSSTEIRYYRMLIDLHKKLSISNSLDMFQFLRKHEVSNTLASAMMRMELIQLNKKGFKERASTYSWIGPLPKKEMGRELLIESRKKPPFKSIKRKSVKTENVMSQSERDAFFLRLILVFVLAISLFFNFLWVFNSLTK